MYIVCYTIVYCMLYNCTLNDVRLMTHFACILRIIYKHTTSSVHIMYYSVHCIIDYYTLMQINV